MAADNGITRYFAVKMSVICKLGPDILRIQSQVYIRNKYRSLPKFFAQPCFESFFFFWLDNIPPPNFALNTQKLFVPVRRCNASKFSAE